VKAEEKQLKADEKHVKDDKHELKIDEHHAEILKEQEAAKAKEVAKENKLDKAEAGKATDEAWFHPETSAAYKPEPSSGYSPEPTKEHWYSPVNPEPVK
jgi:hypothetical protein